LDGPVARTPGIDLAPARTRWAALPGDLAVLPFKSARIVIYKKARRLELYDGSTLVKSYPIGLGRQPEGAKLEKGEGRTPEGQYYICSRIPSQFRFFLGINYPNADDALKGEQANLIDGDQRRRIVQAERNRVTPPWDTAMGGAIGIHVGGAADWTAGCIALTNEAIEELYVATAYWTPVTIKP
jgi:murein L,D-transpeptidase YafK